MIEYIDEEQRTYSVGVISHEKDTYFVFYNNIDIIVTKVLTWTIVEKFSYIAREPEYWSDWDTEDEINMLLALKFRLHDVVSLEISKNIDIIREEAVFHAITDNLLVILPYSYLYDFFQTKESVLMNSIPFVTVNMLNFLELAYVSVYAHDPNICLKLLTKLGNSRMVYLSSTEDHGLCAYPIDTKTDFDRLRESMNYLAIELY